MPLGDQARALLTSALRDPLVVTRYRAKMVQVPGSDRPGDLPPLLATAIRHLPQLRGAQGVRARRSVRWPDLRDLPWPSPTAESLRVLRSTEAVAIDPGSGPDLRTMLRHSAPRTRAMRALQPDQAAGLRRRPGSPGMRAVQRRRPGPRLSPVRTDRPLHADRRCPTCVVTECVTNLLAGPDGIVPTQVGGLHQLLLTENPARPQIWLYHTKWSRLLETLIAGSHPLTHERLDALAGQHQSVRHLRQALIHQVPYRSGMSPWPPSNNGSTPCCPASPHTTPH